MCSVYSLATLIGAFFILADTVLKLEFMFNEYEGYTVENKTKIDNLHRIYVSANKM